MRDIIRVRFGQLALLKIGGLQGAKVALDARRYLLHAPFELAPCKVAITRVDGLELGAVDSSDRMREEAQLATNHDEACADRTDRSTILSSKIGNGLEVRYQTSGQPYQFDIAASISTFLRSRRVCAKASVFASVRATSRAASFTSRTMRRDGMFGQHFDTPGLTRGMSHQRNHVSSGLSTTFATNSTRSGHSEIFTRSAQ